MPIPVSTESIAITHTANKGGVGKTTTAVHNATGLATLGYTTVLIDADSQGHASAYFGYQPNDSLYNILTGKSPVEDNIFQIPAQAFSTADKSAQAPLYLIPSFRQNYKIVNEIGVNRPFVFLEMLEEIDKLYHPHFYIIDTSPNLSEIDGLINLATDYFLIVTAPEALAIHGLREAVLEIGNIRKTRQRMGLNTDILGILPNLARMKTATHQRGMEIITEEFGQSVDVWAPNPLAILWAEATLFNQTVYTHAPTSEPAGTAWRNVARLLNKVGIGVK